ncbi:uncharacterized protein LOC117649746 isoform X2 [Thrips palmi]|uniref:Uncharacterized protein LOC117649746 isoform X2 n=1 Tax=Thrips palmi TaxID=161013 RepID=A0A6P8ZTQ7_THRPL|nr:uncharacterized protein LOC117649746 isoform X2 [Thrips palmi]
MKRTLLLLLLLMALQSLIVTTADTATTNHQPPGETLPSMAEAEQRAHRSRRPEEQASALCPPRRAATRVEAPVHLGPSRWNCSRHKAQAGPSSSSQSGEAEKEQRTSSPSKAA